MKDWAIKMLYSYDYHSAGGFFESLAPSSRYRMTTPLIMLSAAYPGFAMVLHAFFPTIEDTLGISGGAGITLLLAFATELITGIVASHLRKEQFSSLKLSRFTLKVFVYFVIIAIPYHWYCDFEEHKKFFMSAVFDWMQNFIIVQIALENLVSILENMGTISGKEKTHWINKIKDKLTLWE